MAKKKAIKKKTAKKTKRKTTKKKAKRDPLKQIKPIGLHAKKLKVMNAIPVMPCSAVNKDRQGSLYAYTEASKVFFQYGEQCRLEGLVISMVDCEMSTAKYPQDQKTEDGWKIRYIECSRAVCRFRITDTETGQYEEFVGAGLGDNEVWSDTSAQTVAFKEALLLYFMTSWPQPSQAVKILKDELRNLKGDQLKKALEVVLPKQIYKALTSKQVEKELKEFNW